MKIKLPQKTSRGNVVIRNRKKSDYYLELQDSYSAARGEQALWIAVITQAITDARSNCKKSESQYHKREAIDWLTGNGRDFVDVCLCAGMNPDYVRKNAKKAIFTQVSWRAEAGKSKRYEERRLYRQRVKEKQIMEQQAQILQIEVA